MLLNESQALSTRDRHLRYRSRHRIAHFPTSYGSFKGDALIVRIRQTRRRASTAATATSFQDHVQNDLRSQNGLRGPVVDVVVNDAVSNTHFGFKSDQADQVAQYI
jgi:hypothetical protein